MRCVRFDLISSICHGFDIDRQRLQLYVSVHSWCLISILADDDGDDVTVDGWSFLIWLKYVFIINEVQCGVINYFSKPYLKLHIASDLRVNLVWALRHWHTPAGRECPLKMWCGHNYYLVVILWKQPFLWIFSKWVCNFYALCWEYLVPYFRCVHWDKLNSNEWLTPTPPT